MKWKILLKRRLNKSKKWLGLGLLMAGLLLAMSLNEKVTQFFSRAIYKKADVLVEADKELGKLPRPWTNLAQGGEDNTGMIQKVVNETQELSPSYVRLDHIYDYYEVVKKEGASLIFDWSKLDREVEAILQTGAKPFLALSYMPNGFAPGTVDVPHDWGDWQKLVQATIEHYSGKAQKNISDVYYEVWNEPDLFGNFKAYGEKSYLEMYRRSAFAAETAKNVQPFKMGGPATTGMYPAWIEALLKMVAEENLRFDFVSWHRYSTEVTDFSRDAEGVNLMLNNYPELALKEKVVSEWGFDPKNNPGYDTKYAAAHMMAAITQMVGKIHKAFLFEIKDGKDPQGQAYWGRWGLMTHEDYGLQKKPRYELMSWLKQLSGTRLFLEGEGTNVKGLAVKNGSKVEIYLVNFDKNGKLFEQVPLVVSGLAPGGYEVIEERFMGNKKNPENITITKDKYVTSVAMSANEIIKITIGQE